MRKVLSFVLVLTLVLGSFSMAFAATPKDVAGTPNAEAVEILMGLGVVNGYPDGTFKPENIVTRAEMAKMIVVALGLQDYATGTSKFADMSGATWAQGYVNYANGLGIIKGYPDGTFKPSQTVSYDEASAMIVRALGYTDASLLPATWPSNYVVKAKALGVLDSIKSSAAGANRGDIAKMLFNALSADIGTVDADNKWNANDTSKDGTNPDNFLVRLGAKFNAAAVVYGTEESLINLVPYTGKYAETYTNDDKEIIAIDVKSDEIEGNYKANSGTTGAGIVNASTSDDTDYNISAVAADKGVPVFWNGVEEPVKAPKTKYTVDTVSSATGNYTYAVDLSGKRIDEAYAISYWQVNENGLFDETDADDIADADAPSLFGIEFNLDDDDAIDANQYVLEGAASLDDIKADNVVYVYEGYGEAGIKKILVGTEVVTGKVTEEDDGTYTIDGKEYDLAVNEVASGYKYNLDGSLKSAGSIAAPDKFTVGDTITARLDYFGYIYDVTVDSSTPDTYAIVKGVAEGTNGVDADRVKLYSSDDTTKTFNVDTDEVTMSALTTNALIGYGLNKDGEVDTVNLNAINAGAAQLLSAKVLKTGVGATTPGATYPVDKDVVVFTYDGDYDLTTIGDLDTLTTLSGIKQTSVRIILNDDGDAVVAMLVDKAASGVTNDDTYAVINKLSTVPNADNDPIQKVTGFVDGAEVTKYADKVNLITYAVDSNIALFKLTTNAADEITSYTVVSATAAGNALGVVKDTKAGSLQIGTDWYAISDKAVVYQAKLDAGKYDYSASTIGSVKADYTVYLYETDDDNDGYDIVIYKK